MKESLETALSIRFNKEDLIKLINEDPKNFDKLFKIALQDLNPQSWRAAWLINGLIINNDERIVKHSLKIIKSVKTKNDGHQRELLKILDKIKISEKNEGYLFDTALTIWEDVAKTPSVRITAFKTIIKIVKKYPELINEINSFTQKHYTENLSPGIKRSFIKLWSEIKKPSP
jgi:hypothetical protein